MRRDHWNFLVKEEVLLNKANLKDEELDERNADNIEDRRPTSLFFQRATHQVLISVGANAGKQWSAACLLDTCVGQNLGNCSFFSPTLWS